MDKLDNHYDFALVTDGVVKLFNKSEVTGSVLNSKFMVDVEVAIDEFGHLHLAGKAHEYHFTRHRIDVRNLVDTPSKRCIKRSPEITLFGFVLQEAYDYVIGWYYFPCKNTLRLVLTNYTIEVMP